MDETRNVMTQTIGHYNRRWARPTVSDLRTAADHGVFEVTLVNGQEFVRQLTDHE